MKENYSIFNNWYDKFCEIVETGDKKKAVDFYKKAFPKSKNSDFLIGAREYIYNRLCEDLDMRGPEALLVTSKPSRIETLDTLIGAVCHEKSS